MVKLALLFDDGGVMVNVPMDHGRYRNTLPGSTVDRPIMHFCLFGQLAQFNQINAIDTRAVSIEHLKPFGIGLLPFEEGVKRFGTAQIGDARIVAHHPQSFFSPGDGGCGRTGKRAAFHGG